MMLCRKSVGGMGNSLHIEPADFQDSAQAMCQMYNLHKGFSWDKGEAETILSAGKNLNGRDPPFTFCSNHGLSTGQENTEFNFSKPIQNTALLMSSQGYF